MAMTDTDDGMEDLLVNDDIELDADFIWTPKAQPSATISAHDWPEFRGATGSGIRRQWVCRFAVMESQSHE